MTSVSIVFDGNHRQLHKQSECGYQAILLAPEKPTRSIRGHIKPWSDEDFEHKATWIWIHHRLDRIKFTGSYVFDTDTISIPLPKNTLLAANPIIFDSHR